MVRSPISVSVIACCLIVAGCQSGQNSPQPSIDLPLSDTGPDFPAIRQQALREAAHRFGSQTGYRQTVIAINRHLEERHQALSATYDFAKVVLPQGEGYLIPPVASRHINLVEASTDGNRMATAEESLAIEHPGRLAAVIPDWRDYLSIEAQPPELPARSLLPIGQQERRRFAGWMDEGREAGNRQAISEFEKRLSRLRRDFEGMLRYRTLIRTGRMKPLHVESRYVASEGEDDNLRIGARHYRIRQQSAFRSGQGEHQE